MIYTRTAAVVRRIDPLLIALVLIADACIIARAWQLDAWVYVAAVGLWIAGLGVVLLRWTSPSQAAHAARARLADRSLVRHSLVLFGLALVIRVVALDRVPANLNGDEFSQALEAVAFIEGRLRNVFGTSDWYGVPLLYPWLGSLLLRGLGQEPWVWRLVTALGGAAAVPVCYLLVRAQFGRPALGLAAGTLLAFNHLGVLFSRIGSNQGFDALFTAALLLALVVGRRLGSRGLWWYVAGVTAGLGFFFYFALRGVAVLGLAIVVVFALRREAPRLRGPAWYIMGLAMAAAPLLVRRAGQGKDFNARLFQVLDLPDGTWWEAGMALLGRAWIGMRSLQGLGLRGWYESGAGILVSRFELVLLVVGVLIALRTVRKAGWIHPFTLFGILAAVALFTENPVMSQRVTSMTVPAVVLIALGADHFARLIRPPSRADLLMAQVILIAGLNLHHLFLYHLPRRHLDITGLVATELARELQSRPGVREIVFCGGTQMDWDSNRSLPFQLPHLQGRNVDDTWPVPSDPAQPGVGYVVLEGCPEIRSQLSERPTLRGLEMRYSETGSRDALRMYLETGGLGRIRWTDIADEVPYKKGERFIMAVFTSTDAGAGP